MAIIVFVLGLALAAAGLYSGYLSLDLLPTSPGLVYAFAGAVAVVGAIIVFALGALIARVGRLAAAIAEQTAAAAAREEAAGEPPPEIEPVEPHEAAETEAEDALPTSEAETEADGAAEEARPADEAAAGEDAAETAESEEPLNENRAGRLPTLEAVERAIETPEAPPTLIGRYSSGGANYMIFSDGSIEAETDEGAFKFASMGDFKEFLLKRNSGKI